MSDPKYVRLSDRMSNGSLVDTYSHWGITGLDVQEFPTDSASAQTFVRDNLRKGLLEPASKAEFDEVQEANEEVASAIHRTEDEAKALAKAGQEAQVIRTSGKVAKRLAESRAGEGGGAAYDADTKRRKAVLKAQQSLDEGDTLADVADEDDEDVPPTPPLTVGDAPVVTEEQVPADSKKGKGR
jgi:hypothetical protein